MSTIINSLNILDTHSKEFRNKFSFYIDIFDKAFNYQSKIGLEDITILSEYDQKLYKSYLFLAENSNTTAIGALRLFSSNLYSDAFALIRLLYEIASIMFWGNLDSSNKDKIYKTFFKTNPDEKEHRKNEWKLIREAEKALENTYPDYTDIRNELNNFGGHISSKKIFIGNVTTFNESAASTIFNSNFNNQYFLMGLDLTYIIYNIILEQYAESLKVYNGISENDLTNIHGLANIFSKEVRPTLQKMFKKR